MESEEKIKAILTRPDAQPVEVEITDADGMSRKAFVETPAGIELYVSFDDLNCIEVINKDGTRKFLGSPRRTDEAHPIYLVVKDRKEVLA